MSDLFEKVSDFFAEAVKDTRGTLNYVADDSQRTRMVMSMYMGEYFRREAEHATRLLELYETTVFSHPRFERKVAKTAQEDLQYWRKQLLIAEQLDVLLDKVCGGTSQHSSLFTEERSALEAACNKLEKSLQQ